MRSPQAGERLRVGPGWRGTDDYVFSTSWSEPLPHARPSPCTRDNPAAGGRSCARDRRPARPCGPSITLCVYAHVISDQLTEAADILARAVAATS